MKKILFSAVILISFSLSVEVDALESCKKNISTCLPAILRDASTAIASKNETPDAKGPSCRKYPAAFAYNTIDQEVGGGNNVTFNHSLTADACAVVPPNSDDYYDGCNDSSTFKIKKSGWYFFSFQVRGRRRFNISPLVFELTASNNDCTWSINGSRHASQPVVGNGKHVVNGSLMAYIQVGCDSPSSLKLEDNKNNNIETEVKEDHDAEKATKWGGSCIKIRLHNITNSSNSSVFLNNNQGDEDAVVNASLYIERLPDEDWIKDLIPYIPVV